jgi:hypothetical protein
VSPTYSYVSVPSGEDCTTRQACGRALQVEPNGGRRCPGRRCETRKRYPVGCRTYDRRSIRAPRHGSHRLPARVYVPNALILSVVARPLRGEVPTIDLMMGYNKSNASPLLKKFLLN